MQNLALDTLFVGKVQSHFKECESTNDVALKWIIESKPSEGAIVTSYFQSSGKGNYGSHWISENSMNLLVSVILYPEFIAPKDHFSLNIAISLAVYDTIRAILGRDVKIKWPNDIYFKDKKLGGILIETSISSKMIESAVCGVGLNINQKNFNDDLVNPTSLSLIRGKDYNIEDILADLLSNIEKRYIELKNDHIKEPRSHYIKSLYRFGEDHSFKTGKEKFAARIIDINEDGKLVLDRNGGIQEYMPKEIEFDI
ncbi:MAG: biotin--[acetyl-CoA-carboxylase] ligase [Bacteroidetes bacterium]|nr:biotin--[acetyl-CoA-carboxylase] ligase [Bacteroidota bacterium]